MHEVSARARLIWGFSDGEFLWCALLLAVLLGIYVHGITVFFPKVAETEALNLSANSKVYWAEKWAVDGVDSSAAPYAASFEGRYANTRPGNAGDGSVSFEFNDRMPVLEGAVLTIRPALSITPNSIIWLCAGKPVPRGFAVRGEDLTDIPFDLLNNSCRAPRT